MDFLKKQIDTEAIASMLETLAGDIRSGTVEITKAKGDEAPEMTYQYEDLGMEATHTGRFLGDLKLAWVRRAQ